MQALYNCVWALRIAPVYESDGHFPVPDHDLMRFLYSTSTAAFVSDHNKRHIIKRTWIFAFHSRNFKVGHGSKCLCFEGNSSIDISAKYNTL